MENKRFYIFASGSGSNAYEILKHWHTIGRPGVCLGLVTNKPHAKVLTRVKEFNIPTVIVPSTGIERIEHEKKLLESLDTDDVWIFLAGYMRVLSQDFLNKFNNGSYYQVVNIHPSLLPKFQGLHAYERAYESGDAESGITIHLVDEGVDTGKILKQVKFERKDSDTFEDFQRRGLSLEHENYPKVFETIITGNIKDLL